MKKRGMEETTSTLCRKERDEIQPSTGKNHEALAQIKKNMKMSGVFERIRTEAHDLHPRAVHERFLQAWAPFWEDRASRHAHCFFSDPLQVSPWAKVWSAARAKGGFLTASSAPRLVQTPRRAPGGVGGCPRGLARNKCVAFLWVSWQAKQSHPAELGLQPFVYYGPTFWCNRRLDFHRYSSVNMSQAARMHLAKGWKWCIGQSSCKRGLFCSKGRSSPSKRCCQKMQLLPGAHSPPCISCSTHFLYLQTSLALPSIFRV